MQIWSQKLEHKQVQGGGAEPGVKKRQIWNIESLTT